MPVHRHQHDRIGSVYASRAELDDWARSRHLRAEQETEVSAPTLPPPNSAIPTRRSIRWKLVISAVFTALMIGAILLWLRNSEHFWRDPLANAQFQTVTDFDGVEEAAAVSRDGHLVAFLSD